MLRNKTSIECWNIQKNVLESIIDKCVPFKKMCSLERNTSKEGIRKILYKKTMRSL